MRGSSMRLVYATNARMPTEKGHGWQIVKMCEAFVASGAEVELWTPRRRPQDERAGRLDLFEYYGVPQTFLHRILPNVDVVAIEPKLPPTVAVPLIQAQQMAWGAVPAIRARRTRPDLFYTRDIETAAWASLLGSPSVYESHVLPGPGSSRILRWMSRRREPRLIVALTPYVRDAIIKLGFSPERVRVEGHGVDLSPYQVLISRKEARDRLDLPADRKLVGYVGRFHLINEEKGIPELIEAIALIDDPRTMLVCVGGPMDRVPAYLDHARKLGLDEHRLRFVEKVPSADVPLWLRALDVGVIPYPDEPHFALAALPLKLFEYKAAGLAIVASELPSIRLALTDDLDAVLVEPENTRALADGIARVLSDPGLALRLGEAARRSVAGRTWAGRAARILEASLDERRPA